MSVVVVVGVEAVSNPNVWGPYNYPTDKNSLKQSFFSLSLSITEQNSLLVFVSVNFEFLLKE